MIVLQWCKMQIMCLLILAYVGYLYIRDGNHLIIQSNKRYCNKLFDCFFVLAECAVLFDGITAVTVNYTETIPLWFNSLAHIGMFLAYDAAMLVLYWYWVSVTIEIPSNKKTIFYYTAPGVLAVLGMLVTIPKLYYVKGEFTSYSMGIPVYICFGCAAAYCLMTIVFIISKHQYISATKRKSLATTLLCIIGVMSLQVIFPEFLVTSVAITMVTISIYLTMENPSIKSLEHYHQEMVMGFATLVENKDDSTGGHIRRSSAYAVLIAKNLRHMRKYQKIITKDFLDNLAQAAPMHDIGKIGIPDAILQKPGKLTDEEFEKMKEHPVIGSKIIEETFGHLGDDSYKRMAYEIAMYHHEKWNGRGYPNGLQKTGIPLAARIMAVADVFDAVSAKRCYRDALPLEQCYAIISGGRGTDFDPDVVDAFMEDLEKVEAIYSSQNVK